MKEKLFIPPPVVEIRLLDDQPQAFKRILILEDDLEVAAELKRYLESRHFDVYFAKSAVFALREVIEKDDFDIIMCDMDRPNFSGQMFHVAVSRVKPHLCSRFVFITSHDTPAATLAFIKDVNGVILWRPFEKHVLLETINLVLGKRLQRKDVSVKTSVVEPRRTVPAVEFKRNPDAENLRMIHLSVASATKSVRIISSYFLSDEATIKILLAARERAVEVEIYVPSKKSGAIPDAKVYAGWAKLLDAGVKIFSMESAPENGRIVVCDDSWLCSTDSNFQAPNLNIYHSEFTARYLRNLEKHRNTFREITDVPRPSTPMTRTFDSPVKKASSEFFFKVRSMLAGALTML